MYYGGILITNENRFKRIDKDGELYVTNYLKLGRVSNVLFYQLQQLYI